MTEINEDLNYEEDTKIDRHSLEECLTNQAELRTKWSKVWAIAVKERDTAKERFDLTVSRLSRKARGEWELLGFSKNPTDAMVKEWLPSQDEYKSANTDLIDTTFRMNVLTGSKYAFDDRSKALSDLVKLWLNGYYADERMIGKEARELLDDIRTEDHIDQLNITDQKKKLKIRRRE